MHEFNNLVYLQSIIICDKLAEICCLNFIFFEIGDKIMLYNSLGYFSKLTSYNITWYNQAKQEKYYCQQQTIQSTRTLFQKIIQYNTIHCEVMGYNNTNIVNSLMLINTIMCSHSFTPSTVPPFSVSRSLAK